MTYRPGPGARHRARQGRPTASLTPPAELVGQFITWRPKGSDGKRRAAVYGWCDAYDADTQTLTIRVPQEVSPWQPNPERVVTLPLSAGPFSVAGTR